MGINDEFKMNMDVVSGDNMNNNFELSDNCNENPMDQANIFELEQAEGTNDIQALLGSIGSIHSSENIDYQNLIGMTDAKVKSNDGGDLQSLLSEIKNEKEAEGDYFDFEDIYNVVDVKFTDNKIKDQLLNNNQINVNLDQENNIQKQFASTQG